MGTTAKHGPPPRPGSRSSVAGATLPRACRQGPLAQEHQVWTNLYALPFLKALRVRSGRQTVGGPRADRRQG